MHGANSACAFIISGASAADTPVEVIRMAEADAMAHFMPDDRGNAAGAEPVRRFQDTAHFDCFVRITIGREARRAQNAPQFISSGQTL